MLFDFNEKQVNFLKMIVKSILPSPPQCNTQNEMRVFLNTCSDIEKILNNPVQQEKERITK